MSNLILPGQPQKRVVLEPPPGPCIAERIGLEPNDIVEIDSVNDAFVAYHYRLRPGSRCVILRHDEYFAHLPELHVQDPSHLIAVSDMNEPFNLTILEQKRVSWRRLRRASGVKWKDD